MGKSMELFPAEVIGLYHFIDEIVARRNLGFIGSMLFCMTNDIFIGFRSPLMIILVLGNFAFHVHGSLIGLQLT